MITLQDVSYENLRAVIKIYETLSESDKKHVAPNVVSLAEAYLNYDIAWPKAIVLDETIIGFVMLGLDNYIAKEEDWPVYFLWRFMIGGEYQGKGYGKAVLNMLVDKCKAENIRYLYVSSTKYDPMPYEMYIKYGFVDTGEVDDGEQVLKLKIE
ncbi:MAG: GNAT family N-acetyltransferase [Erysipelothrix sp.]|jgi:diamine N-acetyltransferase|nr:GNAT family N-acetyltransferase [Erysipelothrix sp.]